MLYSVISSKHPHNIITHKDRSLTLEYAYEIRTRRTKEAIKLSKNSSTRGICFVFTFEPYIVPIRFSAWPRGKTYSKGFRNTRRSSGGSERDTVNIREHSARCRFNGNFIATRHISTISDGFGWPVFVLR